MDRLNGVSLPTGGQGPRLWEKGKWQAKGKQSHGGRGDMLKMLDAEIDRDSSRKRLLKYTRKAYRLLPVSGEPRILDIGCGSGVPTIELARLSKGTVVGIDTDQSLLDELDEKIEKGGFSGRVEGRKCSMFELDFPDGGFDIIWVEGAMRPIGFGRGLKEWRRLLKSGGFLVVHEEVRAVSNEIEKIPSLGYRLLKHFLLPEDAHWVDYYRPLEKRIWGLHEKYAKRPEDLRALEEVHDEIEMVKANPGEFRTAFYIMQKNEAFTP
jgi:ubiquinone/menaquinone biosynthesis C-methylase UbiE